MGYLDMFTLALGATEDEAWDESREIRGYAGSGLEPKLLCMFLLVLILVNYFAVAVWFLRLSSITS